MEIQHLRYFYEVARAKSFSAAGQKLRVSQPAVTKQVKLLEESVGEKLLDRTKRGGVTLTETGQTLYESCQRLYQEFDQLKEALKEKSTTISGELSFGASDNLCNHKLPPLLKKFTSKYPGVIPRLFSGTSNEIWAQCLLGSIEFGIFYTAIEHPLIEREKIGWVEFVLVRAPDFKCRLEDLENVPCIGSLRTDYRDPNPAYVMLGQLGIRPKVVIGTNEHEVQKNLAIAGLGYSMLPLILVEKELKSGLLKRITAPKKVGSNIYWVKRKGRTLSKAAQMFITHLKDNFDKAAPDHL